jgi:hypothetical protein
MTLEYAPIPPCSKRLRKAIYITVAAIALVVAISLSRPFVEQIAYVISLRHFLASPMRAATVVYDDARESARALVKKHPAAYRRVETWLDDCPTDLSGPPDDTPKEPVGYVPAKFREVTYGDPVIFIGELRAPNEEPEIVRISPGMMYSGVSSYVVYLSISLYSVPDLSRGSRPVEKRSPDGPATLPRLKRREHVRLFAGVKDPNDPSHFTIRYELDGSGGCIDGWLRGVRSITITVRDGPLAARERSRYGPFAAPR